MHIRIGMIATGNHCNSDSLRDAPPPSPPVASPETLKKGNLMAVRRERGTQGGAHLARGSATPASPL